jgi:hypothetical protein
MSERLMLLPSHDFTRIRLVQMPDDIEEHEAFRYVTGIIAQVEEQDPDYDVEDIVESLEERGFSAVEFVMGPEAD